MQELMQQTKEQEDALMRLMMERNELSCEFGMAPTYIAFHKRAGLLPYHWIGAP